jgi:hypothetical protein
MKNHPQDLCSVIDLRDNSEIVHRMVRVRADRIAASMNREEGRVRFEVRTLPVAPAYVPKVGDRVSFPASATSSTRYVGTVIEVVDGLARIEVEGYGPGCVSAVRLAIVRPAPEGSPMDAWVGRI